MFYSSCKASAGSICIALFEGIHMPISVINAMSMNVIINVMISLKRVASACIVTVKSAFHILKAIIAAGRNAIANSNIPSVKK